MVVQSLLRTRILEILKTVQPKNKWKILLVDESSLKIINSALTMSDLTDQFVLRVENMFSQGRAQSRDHEAIYFVVPTLTSIHKIIDDLIPENPKYALGHIFLTERLPANLSRKLKESRSMIKIGTLKELYVNFTAIEKRAFTLNLPRCLKIAFNPSNVSLQKYGLQKMAKSLASILFLMDENPEVRYYGPPKIGNSGDRESPAKLLAEFLRNELDTYVDHQFLPESKSKVFPHTNMLILDRTIDLLSPIIHNSTYMGLLVDLLDFDNMGVNLENSDQARVELNDLDSVWQKVKYMHIANAIEHIASSLRKFASENKVAQWSKASKRVNAPKNASSLKQIEEMKDTLTQLPKYHELTAKYNLHTNLCKNIMSVYNSSSLGDVISVEQNIAVGSTPSKGSPPGFKDIMSLFESGKLTKQEIARVIIAYFAVRDGVPDGERSQLESYFSNDPDIIQIMHNISYLGIRLSSNFLQMIQDKSESVYFRKHKEKKDYDFENDRYIPILKDILSNFIRTPSIDNIFHLIPSNDTTFINLPNSPKYTNKKISDIADDSSNVASDGSSFTVSKNKASWASKRNRGAEEQGIGESGIFKEEKEDIKTYGTRVIIFVIGGISCAELRAAHDVMTTANREVIIGSTNLIIPDLFLNEIETLNMPLDSSDLFGVKSEFAFLQKKNNPSFKKKHAPKNDSESAPVLTRKVTPSQPVTGTLTSHTKQNSAHAKKLFNVPARTESRAPQRATVDTQPLNEEQKKEQKKKKIWKFL